MLETLKDTPEEACSSVDLYYGKLNIGSLHQRRCLNLDACCLIAAFELSLLVLIHGNPDSLVLLKGVGNKILVSAHKRTPRHGRRQLFSRNF